MTSTTIADDFVRIRRFYAHDASRVLDAVVESLPEITRWLPSLHRNLTVEDVGRWIDSTNDAWETRTAFHFAIADAVDEGRVLGGINLFQLQWRHRLANVSYWVRRSAHGKGVATRALRLAAGFGFDQLRLQRIEIVVATVNEASRRVAEKAGAQREGLLRNRIGFNDESVDAFMYSLILGDLARELEKGS